ncbi:MAG: hypothetical protein ACLQUY_05505 [Ktedonobacterales bacterium]
MDTFQPPFRWNLRYRESLGSLLDGPRAPAYPEFVDDLLACAARCLALSHNGDLCFLGRSPESLFDLLSGLLLDTPWADRLRLVPFSMRNLDTRTVRRRIPGAIESLHMHFRLLGIGPDELIAAAHPVVFIDLVASGRTLGHLVSVLHAWSKLADIDWQAVKAKVRIVGITWSERPSPKTWRWQAHAEWVDLLNRGAIKNVAVPWRLWDYLGNRQAKVTESFSPWRWATGELSTPRYDEAHLAALRLAADLFDSGRMHRYREPFVGLLSQERAMRSVWFRSLVHQVIPSGTRFRR